jgi:hypothetical protein
MAKLKFDNKLKPEKQAKSIYGRTINNPMEIYTMYNDMLIDHKDNKNVLDDITLNRVEKIRDYYGELFKMMENKDYELEEFEALADQFN